MARKQFLLRIDPELWKELERWAADDLRSVNAQVEWLLREAMRRRKGSRGRPDGVAGDEADDEAGDDTDGDARDQVVDARPDTADPLVRRRS
jgi:hypothetical protein